MADIKSDGSPNRIAADLQIRQLEVDIHGLEHQVLNYLLQIERWRHEIAKHDHAIDATNEQIREVKERIAELQE